MKQKLTHYLVIFTVCLLSSLCHAGLDEIQVKIPVEATKVKAFSFNVLLAVYDFNHENVMARQKSAAKMFSSGAWNTFLDAIIKSKVLDSVKKNKYTVTTTPLSPPNIIKQGLAKGMYFWNVAFPAMIVFKNDDYQQVQYVNIKQRIVYQDNELHVDKFLAVKGTPIHCQENSKGITVINESTSAIPTKK